MEVPVMLSEILSEIICYTLTAMGKGSMWWWILPLAPDVPERLVVGHERAFLTWFFEIASPCFIPPESVDEYLRSFSGLEGVLGAIGVYRAALKTIEQTEPLRKSKVTVPVIALGGANAQGAKVREMVSMVAVNVTGHVISDCGHFLPEECPEEIARQIQALAK
jgi:pimeloyl-ACP methyl ester carboxylesterase